MKDTNLKRDVRRIPRDNIRAKSLLKASSEAIEAAKALPFQETKLKSILRELYEGLRQYCEAIGYFKGYKFSSHEVITLFLKEILKEPIIAEKFDRYRKLRNGINYYGKDVSEETVKEAFQEIPEIISKLAKYFSFTEEEKSETFENRTS